MFFLSFEILVHSVRSRKTQVDDETINHTQNKLITAVRAMHEYLLKPSFVLSVRLKDFFLMNFSRDLETLKQHKTRSPYSDVADTSKMLTVYRRGDVEKR